MRIIKNILLTSFLGLFVFWLGSGILFEINPKWFMSETAVEIPENPNRFVGSIAAFLRGENKNPSLQAAAALMESSIGHTVDKTEFKGKGTLSIEDKPFTSIADFLAVSRKLDFLKGKSDWYTDEETDGSYRSNTNYYLFQNVLIEAKDSFTRIGDERDRLDVVFTYLNNRPLSAEIVRFRGGPGRAESKAVWSIRTIWQPDGSVFTQKTDGTVDISGYKECGRCYQDALAYADKAEFAAFKTQYVKQAREKSNRIAANRTSSVNYQNMPEIMPKGMSANSLVVGYDKQHRPEKIYWSYDNGKRRQSFEYYLENGRPFMAQSSSVPLTEDGETADFNAEPRIQTWFIHDGKILKEELSNTPPDHPLKITSLNSDIQRYADAAAKRQK